VEALYWSQDDASVLDEASRLASPDAEVLLFRAVSSLRLGLATAHDLVMKLFLDERTSQLHGRFAAFLAAQPGYLPLFSKGDQDVINGRNALLQGAWSTALPLLEDALAAPDPSPVAHTPLLMDMGNAYAAAGRSAAGAVFMQKLSTRLAGQPRADALEQAGKLFRRARDYGDALTLLRTAAEEAPTLDQRDRARWFILDILFALAPADLAARVEAEAAHWNDPDYFADVLEDRLSELVGARKWLTLDALRRALSAHGPDSVQAELDYVLARAWQAGRIRDLAGTSAGELFADAARRDPAGYYGILASSMLGQIPDRAVAGSVPPDGPAGAPLDPFVMGFLSYGLGGEAYQRLWAFHQGLTDSQVLDAARGFAAAGDLRDSLYFVGALARRRKLDTAELELYYPRGYGDILEPLAAAAGISDHVLYGLVREESYFDAAVVSSAGAVGLSQLMPATALPLAQKLKLTDPDLRNPATNLAIGVRHFQDLLGNVDNPVKALLAYNAGLSRLRQWERASATLPPDLLVESVPIAETRQYVRKILVSSVMYAFLYHDADPREAALSFFGIRQGPLGPARQKTGSLSGAS
jgi:soluble lytic murein transglycosylase